MENAAKHFDVDQHREFPAFRQSPQTPQVTRGCFLLPAKGRDLWENPSPAPGTWHAWKYIWREGRISIWKKELTSEEAGRLQHDTNMKSTFMNMDWVGEPRNTYFHICKCRFILHAGQMLKGLQAAAACLGCSWAAAPSSGPMDGDISAGFLLKSIACHKSHCGDRNEGSSIHCLQHHLFFLFPSVKLCFLTHSHSLGDSRPSAQQIVGYIIHWGWGSLSVEGFSHVLHSFFKKIQAWSSKLNLLPWC